MSSSVCLVPGVFTDLAPSNPDPRTIASAIGSNIGFPGPGALAALAVALAAACVGREVALEHTLDNSAAGIKSVLEKKGKALLSKNPKMKTDLAVWNQQLKQVRQRQGQTLRGM